MPSVSELPNFISSIRHPRRNRSVSVGPQSAADAYETLAFRQKSRKESHSTGVGVSMGMERKAPRGAGQHFATSNEFQPNGNHYKGGLPTKITSTTDQLCAKVDDAKLQMPMTPNELSQNAAGIVRSPSQDRRQNEKEEKEIFSMLEKPRVRYDVEVITKLIVYSGKKPASRLLRCF